MKNERGSSMVFLLLILAGILSAASVYIYGAGLATDRAYAESVLHLAGRSVLSEFDSDLKDEYGIIAYRGSAGEAQEAAAMYAAASFIENERITWRDLSLDLTDYCLLDTGAFRKEVVSYTKYALARGLLEEGTFGLGEETPLSLESTRTLRADRVIHALPSGGVSSGPPWETVKHAFSGGLDDVLARGTDNYLFDLYIMREFKNAQDHEVGRETFFEYEAEYILEGKLSDQANRKAFRRELLLVRNAVNLPFLLTDPEKMEQISAAAALIAPGPGALLVESLLAEAWALAEAENDVRMLEHGKKVPAYKTADTWATDLQSIIEGTEQGYIDSSNGTGLAYRDYLQVFLFFMDGTVKTMRVMDLIQINMQGLYDASFLIRDHYLGLAMHINVRGKEYDYVHTY
ncbi:MAG: hypothetical protein II682_04975 [Firmicutes bacterium]|nr:hypothetical protein [Bacillota bacterium]